MYITMHNNELAECKAALQKLMPFILEDYYPNCATSEYKAAVEQALMVINKYETEAS